MAQTQAGSPAAIPAPETNPGPAPVVSSAPSTMGTSAQQAQAAAAPPASPAQQQTAPEEIRFTDSKALSERMDRHYNSKLKKLGIEDEESLSNDLKELQELRAQREQQRQADLSEQERLQEQYNAEKAQKEAAERQVRQMQFDMQIRDECVDLKITNVEYARFILAKAAKEHTGDEPFNSREALEKAIETQAVELGVKSPEPVVKPATTQAGSGGQNPPPSPNQAEPVDATKMSDDEFRRYCAERGY